MLLITKKVRTKSSFMNSALCANNKSASVPLEKT